MILRRASFSAAITAVILTLAGPVVHAITPAGTIISTKATVSYADSTGKSMPSVDSNTVNVTVGQVPGVSIAVSGTSALDLSSTQSGTIAFGVTNTGNGSDEFSLTTTPGNAGLKVEIIRDTNGDGALQSTETQVVSTTGSLAAGAVGKFISIVTITDAREAVDKATASVNAASKADTSKTASISIAVTLPSKVASAYITSWLMNGSYPNTDKITRLAKEYITAEAMLAPKAGDVDGGKTWQLLASSTDRIGLSAYYGASVTQAACYACAYINSPVEGDVLLKIGSADGIKVWLNGSLVWINDTYRDCVPDEDSVPVKLIQGWNRVVAKISENTGTWEFMVKVVDTEGKPITGLTSAADTSDRIIPVISGLSVSSVTSTGATIEWDTDEPATTEAGYGVYDITEKSYGDPVLSLHHSAKLPSLKPATTYQFKVYSADVQNNIANSDALTFSTEASTSGNPTYISEWVINGSYVNTDRATRLSKSYLPSETSIYPYAGYTSNSKAWKSVTAGADGLVKLGAAFGGPTTCVAYAHVYVYSPTTQKVNMLVGSDDGIKVWQNGSVVWTNDIYRGYEADEDKFAVTLGAGWHRFLVKVSQSTSEWKFAARFADSSGNPVPGLNTQTNKPW